jgi:nucleoside-diphosphate-sugar epimerase
VDQMIINVGSGQETSINELARLISQATGRTRPDGYPPVLRNISVSGGISRSVADISLAQRWLGFTPQVSLADGLHRMVHMIRNV